MEVGEFGKLLEEQIPRLRRYARALTRNVSRADDLVQDCLYRAIRKRHLFQQDTRVQTHKIHQTIAATRQTAARKFRANLS